MAAHVDIMLASILLQRGSHARFLAFADRCFIGGNPPKGLICGSKNSPITATCQLVCDETTRPNVFGARVAETARQSACASNGEQLKFRSLRRARNPRRWSGRKAWTPRATAGGASAASRHSRPNYSRRSSGRCFTCTAANLFATNSYKDICNNVILR